MNLFIQGLQHAVKNIFRNKLINFLSFAIIAFTLFINGIFNYITHELTNFSAQFSKNIKAIFYLQDQANQTDIESFITKMRENLLVKKVVFRSKNQAQQQFLRQFPELQYIISEFKESPLPASIEVEFKENQLMDIKVSSFIEEVEHNKIVESKQVNLEWTQKIININKFISLAGLFFSSIMIIVSFFIIFNVIKINIFYRQDEIAVLRLVGATNWYIRFPFIIEGAFLGLVGSGFSCILLIGVLKTFPTYGQFIYDIVKNMIGFKSVPSFILIKLIVMGTAIGIISSFISIRRFLR